MIQIDEMLIRVPGLKEADAAGLGAAVAAKLAERLPQGASDAGKIGHLKVWLKAGDRTPEELSTEIAEQILVQLNIQIR